MAEYIRKDVLINALMSDLDKVPMINNSFRDMIQRDTLIGCMELVNRIPSADVQPVKHGKWIDETFEPWGLVFHPYKCDQCGERSEFDSEYCPNCGAKMEVNNDRD